MKTDLTVAAYIIHERKLLLIYHNKLQKWLPVGGHIELNETPDAAIKREVKEEVGLEVKILNQCSLDYETVEQCTLPFHADVHNVGDHNHYRLAYLCTPVNFMVRINTEEITKYQWVSEQGLEEQIFPQSVREIGKQAFRRHRELTP